MNAPLIFFVICSFLVVFRQFGDRLSAQRSLIWWCVFVFIAVAALDPAAFQGITKFLGVQVVSNFILGALTFFCLLNLLEESAAITRQSRKVRDLITSLAARDFASQQVSGKTTGVHCLVILPTYNEQGALPSMKPSIDELVSTNPSFKVCFVNDGSTDLTSQKLKQLFPGQHCSHITNVGVSGALLSGFRAAMAMGADWAVQCDSDGQHPVEEIPRLVSLAQERSVDVLIGSRYLDPHYLHLNKRSSTPARRLGGICIGFFLRALFRARTVSDPTSGFRVYSVKAMEYFIRRMPDEYPEPEMIALAARGQLVVAEAGVCMSSRHSGESSLGGLRSVQFMVKVITALIGLKLRHLGGARRRFGEELSQ